MLDIEQQYYIIELKPIQIEKNLNTLYNNYHNIMQNNISENQIFLSTIVQENSNAYYFSQPNNIDIPYLKKGDSELYIQQFLSIDSKNDMTYEKNQNENNQSDNHETQLFEIKSQIQDINDSKIKVQLINKKYQQTSKKYSLSYSPSTFHNFQKHLTIALRFLIQIQSIRSDRASILLAKKFWKIFKESSITAKKMLHYILGQRNQHSIDDKLIQKFGFKQLYEEHSQSLINEAKCFLRAQSLRQLKKANLEHYICKRRIKNQKNFIMYIQEFMNELQEGFLKKRVKKQKILKDNE